MVNQAKIINTKKTKKSYLYVKNENVLFVNFQPKKVSLSYRFTSLKNRIKMRINLCKEWFLSVKF